jgi:hypothetical protein
MAAALKPEEEGRMKRFLIAGALLASTAIPAMATPFVDISTYWRVYLPFGTPAGIAIACENGATPLATGGQPGCTDTFSLDKTVTTSGTLSETQTAYVGITNDTGATYVGGATSDPVLGNGLLGTEYAGAYPGSDLGIDDPTTESASFTSSVDGPGVESSYSCSIPGSGGYTSVDRACPDGIGSADVSEGVAQGEVFSGETLYLPYVSTITADFSLPEPTTWAILAMGMLGTLLLKANFLGKILRVRR